MRATRPRFKLSGRPRHGSRPSVEVANRRAPSTRSAAAVDGEIAEDVAPGAGFDEPGRQPALAIAEAFDPGDGDAVIGRRYAGGRGEQRAGAGLGVGTAGVATGAAHEDGDAARIDRRTDSRGGRVQFGG